jgi:hypothetical protein
MTTPKKCRIPAKRPRGKPFTGKSDPRRCTRPPGRPRKEHCFADTLRLVLKSDLPEPLRRRLEKKVGINIEADTSALQALCLGVFHAALNGEAWAVHFIADRTEGRVQDRLEIERKGKATLEIVEEIVEARTILRAESE